jgi:hypothetical protein
MVYDGAFRKNRIREDPMANIYDDFDKRREHKRRFEETQMDARGTPYSAPKKAQPTPKERHFRSDLQQGLLDALLDVGEKHPDGEKR